MRILTLKIGRFVSSEPRHERTCLQGGSTRYDSNRPAQLQRLARVLKFRLYEVDVLYYLGSEQWRRWSDYAMCRLICAFVVRIGHTQVFSWHGSRMIFSIIVANTRRIFAKTKSKKYRIEKLCVSRFKPEGRWSCIAHLSAEDMLKSAVIQEKKFKNIEAEWFGSRSINGPWPFGTHKASSTHLVDCSYQLYIIDYNSFWKSIVLTFSHTKA